MELSTTLLPKAVIRHQLYRSTVGFGLRSISWCVHGDDLYLERFVLTSPVVDTNPAGEVVNLDLNYWLDRRIMEAMKIA